jgi:hypothetical protein
MHSIGVIVGIILVLIFLGVLFWAGKQIFALISPYVGEPFMTLIRIAFVILLVCICIWVVVELLSLGGIVVPFFR